MFVYHAFSLSVFKYIISLFLVAISFSVQKKVNLRFSARDMLTGFIVSVVILLPFWYFMSPAGRTIGFLPVSALLFQLVGISLPEEVYFRGFLQERLGNTVRGVIVVSLLFSFMHLPQLIFYGDIFAVLTFFPSLVMGILYMKTSNVIPSTIFHFFANIIYTGLSVGVYFPLYI